MTLTDSHDPDEHDEPDDPDAHDTGRPGAGPDTDPDTGPEAGPEAEADRARRLERCCRFLYSSVTPRLRFHGVEHLGFVRDKAVRFALVNGADPHVVELAALVHDLNYLPLAGPGTGPHTDTDTGTGAGSGAARGTWLRRQLLDAVDTPDPLIDTVDQVVRDAEITARPLGLSLEAQALSDADTLFKILPFTPLLLSVHCLRENRLTVPGLARKILTEQLPLHDAGRLFYNPEANQRYRRWADTNFALWRCLADPANPAPLDVVPGTSPDLSPGGDTGGEDLDVRALLDALPYPRPQPGTPARVWPHYDVLGALRLLGPEQTGPAATG